MNLKSIALSLLILFSCNILISQEIVRIKGSGCADISIRIIESGHGDVSVRFKDSGIADLSIGFTNMKSKADFVLKYSGHGNRSVRIKENGHSNISIRIKENGHANVSIRIKESGLIDYLIYSENEKVSKNDIIAVMINIIKQKAGNN